MPTKVPGKASIKAILFDLDNTLMDFMRLKTIACEEAVIAMSAAGLHMDKAKAMKILFELYEKHGWENKEIFQIFLEKTLGTVDYKILASGIVAYRRIKEGYIEPYPTVIPTLIKLKEQGMKLGVVTDAPRLRAWIRLASMKLTYFFDVVITFEDTGKLKPSPLPFQAALAKLHVRPQQSLMVGDWIERDIKGAKLAGMKTCYARYGEMKKAKRSGADFEIDNISALLSII